MEALVLAVLAVLAVVLAELLVVVAAEGASPTPNGHREVEGHVGSFSGEPAQR